MVNLDTRVKSPHPDRNLNGDCLKIGPYFTGHSKVSRSIRRVSDKPKCQNLSLQERQIMNLTHRQYLTKQYLTFLV